MRGGGVKNINKVKKGQRGEEVATEKENQNQAA
jgi:hypothetical protein